MSNSVAYLNVGYGIGVGTNGTVRASNNTVTRNSDGLVQNAGVFESAGNNIARGNTTQNTIGTITPFGPI